MRQWPQSSQASTCPPRDAVRQCSIADITLSCCRLKCPAWAARYAGPAVRKMSATSTEVRTAQPSGEISPGLNRPSLSSGLVTVRTVRVATLAQRVRPDPLGNVGGLCRLDDDAMELAGADRLHRMLSREQPAVAVHHALLSPDLPP